MCLMHYSASQWHEWASNSCLWGVIRNVLILSGITAFWGSISRPYLAICEVPRRCSMDYRMVGTLGRAVYGLHLIYGSLVWGRLRKQRWRIIIQWNLAAHHSLFRMGPRSGRWAHSINRLIEVITHGLCGYSGVMTSWYCCQSSCGWSPLVP